MSNQIQFGRHSLDIDAEKACQALVEQLRQIVHTTLHRQGAVVGISGGIDSSVVLALCARAFGPEHVIGVLLPESESSDDSARLAHLLAAQLGVQTVTENISAALQGFGCYTRRDEAIKRVIPEYEFGWGAKITLAGNLLNQAALNVFRVTVTSPDGREISKRLPMSEFAQIVAASNFKQRSRMSMLYYHAELRNYAVIGTANKNEYALGFFVKYGDGGVDTQPIGHLFKTQIYQLAKQLNIPEEIQKRTPTTDTYPGGSTQEEFFYRVPFDILDSVWLGYERGVPNEEIARALELSIDQVQRIVSDIASKQHATAYLRAEPIKIDDA
ncbi:MAG TPA: NAD(+) synthase [Anaerolineae bacterium]|nr:NAD(+) synthase [Anaerolineae bacterium]